MKKNIALLAGGYSGEHVISIQTARNIRRHLDEARYQVYTIVIDRKGWRCEDSGCDNQHVDLNDFSIQTPSGKVRFDAAFIAIHGSPGEDGKLQGYLDMVGVPYTGCHSIVSALTFNKSYCNSVVKATGVVNVANSVRLLKGEPFSLGAVLEELQLPLFVKPNESGSSLGISKVSRVENLLPAISKAFAEDDQVLIEEFISGRELTIGVYRQNGQIRTLPPTEIISKNEFFDYEAKYTPGVTNEVTPAEISQAITEDLQTRASAIYRHLNCVGIVRMDFILRQPDDSLFFLEVNTMPGQSDNSIVPQQVRADGLSLADFYNGLLAEVCETNPKAQVAAGG